MLYLSCSSLCLKSLLPWLWLLLLWWLVFSGMLSLSLVTRAPSVMGPPAILGQCDVVLPPQLTPSHPGGVIGLEFVPQQQPSSSMPLQALSHPPFCMIYVCCLFWCLLSTFYFQVPYWMTYSLHPWGLNHCDLHCCNPLELTCGRHMCNLVMVIGPHLVCTEWLLPPLPWVGWSLLLLSQLFPSHPIYMVGHTALVAWQRVT